MSFSIFTPKFCAKTTQNSLLSYVYFQSIIPKQKYLEKKNEQLPEQAIQE